MFIVFTEDVSLHLICTDPIHFGEGFDMSFKQGQLRWVLPVKKNDHDPNKIIVKFSGGYLAAISIDKIQIVEE